MAVFFLESIFNELIRACLIDVVLKPRQIELVHAETDKVEKWLNIIYWSSCWVHIELSDRRKHWIALEMLDVPGCDSIDALSESEVNHVVITILDANIVKFNVPMAKANIVELTEGWQYLLSHISYFDLEFYWTWCWTTFHIWQPSLIQVNSAMWHQ